MIVGERLVELIPWWHVRFTLVLARGLSQLRRRCRYANLKNVLPLLKNRPLFMIAGKRDTYVVPEVPKEICRLAGQPEAVWVVPGAKHNLARLVAAEEYDRRLVEFFEVLDPSDKPVPLILINGGHHLSEGNMPATQMASPPR